jgi:hypothetical protein
MGLLNKRKLAQIINRRHRAPGYTKDFQTGIKNMEIIIHR